MYDILCIIHFSDVTLLLEQWIIFKNLQFILLFLNIWTLTYYCFRLKHVTNICWDFRVSNHYRAFWHSMLPSNLSATVTTLLSSIISIYDAWYSKICKKQISTICIKKQLINIYKTRYKYFRCGIMYVQNWRVCELLKYILAAQKQLTNRPQVITNYININENRKHECR